MATAQKGVLYVGHLPCGFYDTALKRYFKQFGRIRKVRVERSIKTGRPKGYAFIEFVNEEVAKIAAEATDNYVINRKVLKAKYIPPEEMKGIMRKRKKVVPKQRITVRKTNLCAPIGLSKRSLIKKQSKCLKLHEKLAEYGVKNYDLLPINLENLEKRIEESADRKERLEQLRKTTKVDIKNRKLNENVITRIIRGRNLITHRRRLLRAQKAKKAVLEHKPVKKGVSLRPMAKKIDTFERALDSLRERVQERARHEADSKVRARRRNARRRSKQYLKELEKGIVKEPKSKRKSTIVLEVENMNTSNEYSSSTVTLTEKATSKVSAKDRLKSFRHKAQNMHYKYMS